VDLELNRSSHSLGGTVTGNKKIEEKFEALANRIEELTKLINMKTERIAVKQKMMEERQEDTAQDTQKKFISLMARHGDLPKVEFKIQEMIERHNQVVRMFENRLTQMKRVIDEQNMQLLKTAAEFDEARREISRLKRL